MYVSKKEGKNCKTNVCVLTRGKTFVKQMYVSKQEGNICKTNECVDTRG